MNTRRKALQFYNSIWIHSKCTKCKRSSWLCLLALVLTSVSFWSHQRGFSFGTRYSTS